MPSAEHMEMDVIDALTSIGIGIHHQTKAPFCDSFFPCDLIGNLEQMADDRVVSRINIESRRNMFSGDYNNMNRGLGIYVLEGHHALIFIDDL